MPLLNTANKVYLGSAAANRVYLGSNLVWPTIWTPTQIAADLCLWMKADAITATNGQSLDTVNDSGPDGRTMTKMHATGPTYLTNQINGLPALDCAAGKAMKTNAGNISFLNFAVCLVWKGVNAGGTKRIIDHSFQTGWYIGRNLATDVGGGVKNTNPPYGIFAAADQNAHVVTVQRNSTTHLVRVDGGATTATQTVVSTATTATSIWFGADDADSAIAQPPDLLLAECVILDQNVTTTSRDKVEGYLAWKYGLQGNLPSGHAYKAAAP
jgi:hypothetical protein